MRYSGHVDQTVSHVEVNDSPFRRSHGISPRGRGSWAFAPALVDASDSQIIWVNDLYSAARASAKRTAAASGWSVLYVLS